MIDPRMMRTKPLTPKKSQSTAPEWKLIPATAEDLLEAFGERLGIVLYDGKMTELEARDIALKTVGRMFRVMKLVRVR